MRNLCGNIKTTENAFKGRLRVVSIPYRHITTLGKNSIEEILKLLVSIPYRHITTLPIGFHILKTVFVSIPYRHITTRGEITDIRRLRGFQSLIGT